MYEIETEDFYNDIKEDMKKKFYTSNSPETHPSGIKKGINKKITEMFINAPNP